MTALAERLPSLACVTMRVKEWNDTIVFLHEVMPGRRRPFLRHPCRQAGGAAAARGGARAKRCCVRWRKAAKATSRWPASTICRCSTPPRRTPKQKNALEEALRAADPDALTPKEALELLYDLKRKLASPT